MTTQLQVSLPDKEEFADRVVAEAARQMLQTFRTVDEDGNQALGASELARRIETAVIDTIHEQAAALTPQIAEQVLAQGVQTTDGYGYPSGSKKPLGAVIAERVETTLNGAKYGSTGKGLIAELISKEVDRQLRTELSEALADAKRKVMKAVSDEATNALRQAIEKALPEVTF